MEEGGVYLPRDVVNDRWQYTAINGDFNVVLLRPCRLFVTSVLPKNFLIISKFRSKPSFNKK
jgi:hypothetical protein